MTELSREVRRTVNNLHQEFKKSSWFSQLFLNPKFINAINQYNKALLNRNNELIFSSVLLICEAFEELKLGSFVFSEFSDSHLMKAYRILVAHKLLSDSQKQENFNYLIQVNMPLKEACEALIVFDRSGLLAPTHANNTLGAMIDCQHPEYIYKTILILDSRKLFTPDQALTRFNRIGSQCPTVIYNGIYILNKIGLLQDQEAEARCDAFLNHRRRTTISSLLNLLLEYKVLNNNNGQLVFSTLINHLHLKTLEKALNLFRLKWIFNVEEQKKFSLALIEYTHILFGTDQARAIWNPEYAHFTPEHMEKILEICHQTQESVKSRRDLFIRYAHTHVIDISHEIIHAIEGLEPPQQIPEQPKCIKLFRALTCKSNLIFQLKELRDHTSFNH